MSELADLSSGARFAALWLAEHGGTAREAASRFAVSAQAVGAAWRALWPDRPVPRRATSLARQDQIVALAEFRYSVREIASRVGVSGSVVRRTLTRRGVAPRRARATSERSGGHDPSVSPESRSRSAARWLASSGGTVREAAVRFELSSQAVSAAWHVLWPDRQTPHWSTSARDDQIVALAEFRYLTEEIATRVGVSDSTVRRVLAGRGVAARTPRSREREVVDRAISLLSAGGLTVGDVAAMLEIRDHRLQRHLRIRGFRVGHGSTQGRMDGRTARAVAFVLSGQASVVDASVLEQCASAGVYRALRALRESRGARGA